MYCRSALSCEEDIHIEMENLLYIGDIANANRLGSYPKQTQVTQKL